MGFPLAGPLIAGGARVVAGLLGRSGQRDANEANLRIARENREFQERMSNTAYQRSAKDLEAAGLNRILALGQPATTPAGNIATMQNENAKLQEGISGGVESYLTAKLMNANIANINARTNLTEAQRKIISPATEIGETGGSILKRAKRGWRENLFEDTSGVIGTMQHKAEQALTSAKQWAQNSRNFNFGNSKDARQVIIDQVSSMDMNTKGWSNDKKYQWALDNNEKLERYLKRKRR